MAHIIGSKTFFSGLTAPIAEDFSWSSSKTWKTLHSREIFVFDRKRKSFILRSSSEVQLERSSFVLNRNSSKFPKSRRKIALPRTFLFVFEDNIYNCHSALAARETARSFLASAEEVDSSHPANSGGKVNSKRSFQEDSRISSELRKLLSARQREQEAGILYHGPQSPSRYMKWKHSIQESGSGIGIIEAAPVAPLPPFTGTFITAFGFILIIGSMIERWTWHLREGVWTSNSSNKRQSIRPQIPTGISVFLERDLRRKESVEWVNMVLGKLWKVYRIGLEIWLVGLLQPLIDNLTKPDYVKRVEIRQFFLGNEPISVRSVERRTSRRIDDLQYNIGLRYTGGARVLLYLELKFGFLPVIIPVGVRGFDVDGEIWVKLQLIQQEPYVGTATWAFAALPKIKLDLAPFRLFNLMAIPFLSVFLTKLLTQDLPQLFVLPKKNVIDFLEGKAVGPVPKDFKEPTAEGNKNFSGELSATIVEARRLKYIPYGKTDPYVILTLGDQIIHSKRNSQTSVIGPPGAPIWNQDFQLLVADPNTQRLGVQIRDSFGFTTYTVGTGEVELNTFQDTVPVDRIVTLRGGWGLFSNDIVGEIMLRLTYKAYIEDEEEDREKDRPVISSFPNGKAPTSENKFQTVSFAHNTVLETTDSGQGMESIQDMFVAVVAEVDDEVNAKEVPASSGMQDATKKGKVSSIPVMEGPDTDGIGSESTIGEDAYLPRDQTAQTVDKTVMVWLGLLTAAAVLVAMNLNFSNLLNP